MAIARYIIASVDFNTLSVTAACIAWNMWRPSKQLNKRSMLLILAGLWLVCSLLISLPYLTLCEELVFGFDRRTGKCTLVYCDKCNGDQSDIFLLQHHLLSWLCHTLQFSSNFREIMLKTTSPPSNTKCPHLFSHSVMQF